MQRKILPRPIAWGEMTRTFAEIVRRRVPCDGVVVGIINLQKPRPDEIVVCDNLSTDAMEQWVEKEFKSDQLFRTAQKNGTASGSLAQSGLSGRDINKKHAVAYHVIPDGYMLKQCWVMMTTRKSEFSEDELLRLNFALRQWSAHFNRPRESKMCRYLVGCDDRIIHGDPRAEELLIERNVDVRRVMSELRETVLQRWPNFQDEELHDVVFAIGNDPFWIRIKRQQALPVEQGESWYVEMRQLDPGEMIPNGVVFDDRIGQALGYMHDNYNRSPGLNEVSNYVEISPFHFHRLFSRLVGTTPKQYVLQKQIQMAKWMLRSRNMPISAVARETGFASHGHFTSTFRRMVGLSPSQYRFITEA